MFKPLIRAVKGSAQITYLTASLILVFAAGCGQEMANQRRAESQEHSSVFADGTVSQAIPEHTIPASPSAVQSVSHGATQAIRGWLNSADATNTGGYLTGKVDGQWVHDIPEQVLQSYGHDYKKLIRHGQERFSISCVPCHDQTGSGNGMVSRRGLKFPPSYHTDRLRQQPLGYIYHVATNGRGQMPAYGDYLSTDDRWAITAYVRTLQFAQYAPVGELPDTDRQQIHNGSRQASGELEFIRTLANSSQPGGDAYE
ncbi:MAG: c-type cytochrome [Planctomycetaceae bacterium]|nr:c-type cytochrome [Planctomycetaceae bacterium]